MRARSLAAMAVAATALTFGVAACGDDDGGDGDGGGAGSVSGKTLTIYSSLPLQGDSRPQSESVINGEKLALEEAGGKAGDFTIKYVSLDNATAAAGKWDPGATSSNARKAAQDKTTIGYLGEFNSGASAISIPILNQGGIMQISPSNTAVGLTDSEGAEKGEPDKYYPTGKRTYARVVPYDGIQAAAQASYMKDEGCTKVYILNDKEVYGTGIAGNTAKASEAAGLTVLANDGIDTKAANFRTVASKVESSGADCMMFGGITQNKAVQLWKDIHASNSSLKLFGPDGVAESPFTGELSESEQKVTFITAPTLDPELYPEAGQKFFTDYKTKFGKDPEPYAIYGYEAMALLLDAITRAGDKGGDRQAVIDQAYATKDRESVLGTYSVNENGDTTLTDYGGYKVEGGKLVFNKVIKAATE